MMELLMVWCQVMTEPANVIITLIARVSEIDFQQYRVRSCEQPPL